MTGKRIEDLNAGSAVGATDKFPVAQPSSPAKYVTGLQIATYVLSTLGATTVLIDGNSHGSALVIGTNDSNILSFETNAVTRLSIAVNGNLSYNTDKFAITYATGNTSIGGAGASGSYRLFLTGSIGTVIGGIEMSDNSHVAYVGNVDGTNANYEFNCVDDGYFRVSTNAFERMRILGGTTGATGGQIGIGVTAPTAGLHLRAGQIQASTAPLKFTTGPLMTTFEAGAMEYLTPNFYLSNAIGRHAVPVNSGNTLGAAMSIGTQDAFGLSLLTNNTAKLVINGSGDITTTNMTYTVADGTLVMYSNGVSGEGFYVGHTSGFTSGFGVFDGGIPANPLFNVVCNAAAMSGSDAGANVVFTTYSDAYASTGVPILIERKTANMSINRSTSLPTAKLHIGAGTINPRTAPIKLTSGPLLTTAETGAIEFLTDKAYLTITTGAARKEFTMNDGTLTSGRVPFATTNGRLTDDADFTFSVDTLSVTKLDTTIMVGTLNFDTGVNIATSGAGTKIGTTASDKLSFFGATPIVQLTTGVSAATNVGGVGTTVKVDDTFDGYTIAKVVKALRNIGILA